MCAKMNADPTNKIKAKATVSKWTPEMKAKRAAPLKAHYAKMPAAERAARKARGLDLVATALSRPDVVEKREASRARAGAKRTETLLGWCPIHRRADYTHLVNSKRLKAADAKAYILENEKERIVIEARRAVMDRAEQMRQRHLKEVSQRY